MAICRFNFGKFEEKEFRKFLRMGSIFFVLIGVYWTMRPLKDSLFMDLVGKEYIPYAKTVSLILMMVFVAIYTKILDFVPKAKLLSLAPPIYFGSIMSMYAVFIWAFKNGSIEPNILTVVLGYFWYFFVESFGSVIIALFWSFSTEITKAESAKQGFPLIYTFGQLGGVLFPFVFVTLPLSLGFGSNTLSILILAAFTLVVSLLVRHLVKKTPDDVLEPVDKGNSKGKTKEKTGFIEGLKLLFTHKYLLGMFAVNFFFEFIVTVFDFNFKYAAGEVYSGVELTSYLATYGTCVNIVSLAFLLLGVSNITKKVGIGIALAMVPVLFGMAVLGFLTFNELTFLFVLMIGCKAINYAVSGPALKQLYIPTSKNAKSKSQAWIETFGSRFSKEAGSCVNMLRPVLGTGTYRLLTSGLGFSFVALWFVVALFLGRTYKKAVDSDTIVC